MLMCKYIDIYAPMLRQWNMFCLILLLRSPNLKDCLAHLKTRGVDYTNIYHFIIISINLITNVTLPSLIHLYIPAQ